MSRVLLACLLWVLSGSSVAQTFACQYVETVGLDYESGAWRLKRFIPEAPFFINLSRDGKRIERDSAMNLLGVAHTCVSDNTQKISCMGTEQGYGDTGQYLIFDPRALRGGVAKLLVSIQAPGSRMDSLAISPFVCQKM